MFLLLQSDSTSRDLISILKSFSITKTDRSLISKMECKYFIDITHNGNNIYVRSYIKLCVAEFILKGLLVLQFTSVTVIIT